MAYKTRNEYWLDDYAEKRIRDFGAVPSFKGYHGFHQVYAPALMMKRSRNT